VSVETSTLLAKQVSRQVEMQDVMPHTVFICFRVYGINFEGSEFGVENVPHAEVLLLNLDLQLTVAEGAPLLLQLTLAHLKKLDLPKTHKANHGWTAK